MYSIDTMMAFPPLVGLRTSQFECIVGDRSPWFTDEYGRHGRLLRSKLGLMFHHKKTPVNGSPPVGAVRKWDEQYVGQVHPAGQPMVGRVLE